MSEISDVVNKFEIEKAYYYGCKEDLEKAYQQGKSDGVREFVKAYENADDESCKTCDREEDYCCIECFMDKWLKENNNG